MDCQPSSCQTSGGGAKLYVNIVNKGGWEWKRLVGRLDVDVRLQLSDAYLHFKTHTVHQESNPVTAHFWSYKGLLLPLSRTTSSDTVVNSRRWRFKFK